ncbi:MAG: DUF3526 domain-containing protein [Verrucomicrobia bacterium]|nr:DUF3526 domain-containing protein [Verrucomicrobiota bacterium]
MSPAASIARAEFALLVRRRSYGVLLALFAVLLALAAILGAVRQNRERAQQTEYQALVRAQWTGQPDRHPHRVAHYGTFAFKPVGPLAAYDPGVESFAGRIQYLEAHRQNAANFAEAGALSAAFRLGELSPAFIVQLLLPLLVIILGHRLVAEDRESGRLRLLLAQGVSGRTLVLGKTLGLLAACAPFLALAALATLPVLSASTLPRLALITLATALHTAGWIALTLWLSTRLPTAPRALGGLVACWIAQGIVIPRAAAALAAATFNQLRTDTLARYGVTRVEDLPVNFGAIVMARSEELSAAVFARHYDDLAGLMQRQETLVHGAALLAPGLGLRAISAAAAGTDLGAQLKFHRDAEAHRYAFVQKLNQLHRDEIRFAGDRDQRLGSATWSAFPDFHAQAPALRDALRDSGLAWLALLLWVAAPLTALLRTRALRP